MAKKNKKKSNFKDTTAETPTVVSDFITVDVNQIDLEDAIEVETKPYTEEERVGVPEAPNNPRFKTIKHVKLKDTVQLITNQNLTEAIKEDLINNHGYCEDDFTY